jgi:hypothetical protein
MSPPAAKGRTFDSAEIIVSPSGVGIGELLFRTMRSQDYDVIVVRRTINLGYWEFGMGRG